jgi:hypothetical protein
MRIFLLLTGGLILSAAGWLHAQTPAPSISDIPQHPWVMPVPNNQPATYFVNLKDGDIKETPFVARFGLSMRGLVPAGKAAGRAGHHHLLINQDLPLDFKKPLPFTDQYIHFGKGQMEMVVNMPPGTYDLRLVLADKGHIPYFVYSKPLKITVSKQNKSITPDSVQGPPRIEILGVSNRENIRPPFRLQFHASNFNISDQSAKVPDTGHFRLIMGRAGYKTESIDFTGGQTESWLNPPNGNYNLRLELVNNVSGKPMATLPEPLTLNVTSATAPMATPAAYQAAQKVQQR